MNRARINFRSWIVEQKKMRYAILFRLYNETLTTPSIRDWINKTKMFKTVTNLFIYFVILFRYVLSLCFSRLFKIRAAAVFLWKIFINFICYVCGGSSEQSDEKTQWIIIKYVIAYFGVTFSYFVTNTDRWFFLMKGILKILFSFIAIWVILTNPWESVQGHSPVLRHRWSKKRRNTSATSPEQRWLCTDLVPNEINIAFQERVIFTLNRETRIDQRSFTP